MIAAPTRKNAKRVMEALQHLKSAELLIQEELESGILTPVSRPYDTLHLILEKQRYVTDSLALWKREVIEGQR